MTDRDEPSSQGEPPRPDPAAAHRSHGTLLYRHRQFAGAAAEFSAWARMDPNEALAEFYSARALLLSGELEAAENACRRAVELDPKLVRGHLLLARLSLAQNRLGQAQAHLKRAVASRPQGAMLRAMLARVMMRRSRFETAVATAQEALRRDPRCRSAALLIAELHLINGEGGKAAAILAELERQSPDWPELRRLREQLNRGRNSAPAVDQVPSAAERRAARDKPAADTSPAQRDRSDLALDGPSMSPSWGPGTAAVALSLSPAYAQTDLFDHIFLLRALILRELRLHYRDTRLGFLSEYIRPATVMTLHYIVFTAINKYMPAKIPTELFVLGSFTTWYATSHVIRATMSSKRTASPAPGVTEIQFGFAKMVWEFLSMFCLLFVCVMFLMLIGWRDPFPNVPRTVLYFAVAATLGWGIGLTLQAVARKFPATEMLQKSVLWILFITSGHYFSISGGRHGLWEYIWWNPTLHIAELQRNAFDPGYPTQLVTVWYPIAMAAVLLIVGLVLNKCTRHLVRE